jgi:hypothetical protein
VRVQVQLLLICYFTAQDEQHGILLLVEIQSIWEMDEIRGRIAK